MRYLVDPHQTQAAAKKAGLAEGELTLGGIAVLTFSRGIVERLGELCALEDADWLGSHVHPYSGPHVVKRGNREGLDVIVLVPPMGASPLACTIEDLAAGGIRAVFLACAAWSLGPPVTFGDLLVPSFAVGPDGTSIHYGNTEQRVEADEDVVQALADAVRRHGAAVHVGGNGCCEALYRISGEMAAGFREQGCFSLENGEAAVLFSACRTLGITGGALFHPYIDLTEGWNPARFDETYQETCTLQADVVVDAAEALRANGAL